MKIMSLRLRQVIIGFSQSLNSSLSILAVQLTSLVQVEKLKFSRKKRYRLDDKFTCVFLFCGVSYCPFQLCTHSFLRKQF